VGGTDSSDSGINYRKDGEPATLKSIAGVWEVLEDNSGSSVDWSHIVIRDDGTYMEAAYSGETLPNGQVGCYSISESTIEEGPFGEGSIEIGRDTFDVYTYENKMGYYYRDLALGIVVFDSEYERLTNTEAEFNFTPICQG